MPILDIRPIVDLLVRVIKIFLTFFMYRMKAGNKTDCRPRAKIEFLVQFIVDSFSAKNVNDCIFSLKNNEILANLLLCCDRN